MGDRTEHGWGRTTRDHQSPAIAHTRTHARTHTRTFIFMSICISICISTSVSTFVPTTLAIPLAAIIATTLQQALHSAAKQREVGGPLRSGGPKEQRNVRLAVAPEQHNVGIAVRTRVPP